jgi:hypothetical protein
VTIEACAIRGHTWVTLVMKSTLSFSLSMRSDTRMSGSYLHGGATLNRPLATASVYFCT